MLSELDPDELDDAARRFAAAERPDGGTVALRRQVGTAQPARRDRMFVAAVEHGGVVRGQVSSDSAGGEILGVRRLLHRIGMAGRVVTAYLDMISGLVLASASAATPALVVWQPREVGARNVKLSGTNQCRGTLKP